MNLNARISPVVLVLALGSGSQAESPRSIEAESVLIRLVDDVDVPARASGVLALADAVEGQHVKKGQSLGQIDDVEARLNQKKAEIEFRISRHMAEDDIPVRSAQKTLDFNRSDMRRVGRAAKEVPGSISATQLEETALRFNQAKLELERAERDLTLAKLSERLKANELELSKRNVAIRRILSPINGVIVEVVRKPGEWVQPGDKVFRVVRTDRLRAEGLVRADDVLGVTVGTPVTVSVDLAGSPQAIFRGEIVFVSPEISPVNGLVRVWAEVDNQSGLLRPGLRSRMSIAAVRPSDVPQQDNGG